MVGTVGVGRRSLNCFNLESSCVPLLKELEVIWTEIGETEVDKDCMILELERECMEVYRRKVEEATNARAQLHKTIAAKEAELATLRASLGETTPLSQTSNMVSLKEQLASIGPQLEELKLEKREREKLFAEIKSQIEKINGEITDHSDVNDPAIGVVKMDELDLSLRKINEHQAQLRVLQKEKSDRIHKVLEYVNEVHCLCGVLGMDFRKTLDEVHPSLHEADTGQSNISNSTLDGLSQAIVKLKREKKARVEKLRQTLALLYELWNLMDSSEEERRRHAWISLISTSADDIKDGSILSLETLQQVECEVERLTKLKASRMKDLLLNKRFELEEICRWTHIVPDKSTDPDKISALIDSGILDASNLLDNIEDNILKAKEESINRKEILDRTGKWLAACEEEKWLEDYNQDDNRYSAGRGAHLNLKRAERARITVTKIPGIVDNLMNRIFAWEDERSKQFMYDGVRLVSILEEYKLSRHHKEVENKRYREQKRMQDMLHSGKEPSYGSKAILNKSISLSRSINGVHGNGNERTVATPRRGSAGGAATDLLTLRSYSGRHNGYFKETRRLPTVSVNSPSMSKDESPSLFASVNGSEPGCLHALPT